jgi:hypothetical protein
MGLDVGQRFCMNLGIVAPVTGIAPGSGSLERYTQNIDLHLTATKWPFETMGHIGTVPPPTKCLWSQR